MSEMSQMRRRIMAMDFAIYEIDLFLDTHPKDKQALTARLEYRKKRDEMVADYVKRFGPYVVTTNDVMSTDRWTWIENPWPWDYVPET